MTVAEQERERLSQKRFLDWIRQDFQPTVMLPVWWDVERPETIVTVYCALIPDAKVEEVLRGPTWDLMIGDGKPGAVEHSESGRASIVEYFRFGDNTGVEPLVFHRSFHGLRESYVEVSEEFRLFHDLCHDRTTDRYVKFDDAGNESHVIVVEPDRIRIRLAEIRQFLAVKDMHLAVYFDNREHSRLTLAELGLSAGCQDARDGLVTHGLSYGDFHGTSGWQAFSRLLGKRLFPPFPKEMSGLRPFSRAEPTRLVEFIVGLDETGKEIHGATAQHGGGPEYLTPVWFRKAVLDKYYHEPNKYSVEDSYLRCGSLWGMTMDNHHDDYVVAWLGDLGRDLPYQEQLHWRSYNVPQCGPMSKVFFDRQICAIPTDSDQPDIKFRCCLPEFCARFSKQLGWPLFLPLAAKDQHSFDALRIPASNEQKEFDDLVLALAKVLVDSLNEAELCKLISPDHREGVKGISRLERVLAERRAAGYEDHIQFLRDLQELRSTGSAHRKGTKYQKVARRFATDSTQLPQVFRGMLVAALRLIEYLESVLEAGVFGPSAREHPSEIEEG